ncbi:MAG: hypothetical protein Q4B09_02610 [Lachnospiraceae bacterium]|nr:hypothetical protein [Lachnospiraceae bacterium]
MTLQNAEHATSQNAYPRTFYKEIIDEIDPELSDFYENSTEKSFFNESFYDFATGILSDTLGGRTRQDEVVAIANAHRKKCARKKRRWYDSLKTNATQLTPASKQYPFRQLATKHEVLTVEDWKTLYGDRTYDDVVQEEIEKTRLWSEDPKSRFIHYPGFSSLTPQKSALAIEEDLTSNMLEILDRLYGMKVGEVLKTYVEEMASASFFTDSRRKYELPADGRDLTGSIAMSEDGTYRLMVTVSREAFGRETAITMPDAKDQELLFYIISRAANSSADGSSVMIPVGDLARRLSPTGKAASKHYDEAIARVRKIANFTYNIQEGTKWHGAINYISAAILRENEGKSYLDITLGQTISDALLNNKIKRFSSYEYGKLELNISKIIYIHLQRERIRAFMKMQNGYPECSGTYGYDNFLKWVNFSTNNKRKNMHSIKEALAEFESRHIMIERMESDNISGIVKIFFIPLSEDEVSDLSLMGFNEPGDTEIRRIQ